MNYLQYPSNLLYIYIYILITLSFQTKYCQKITTGKGIGHVYEHIQINRPYTSPTILFSVTNRLVYTNLHITTGIISASPDKIIQTKPLLRPNTTNKLDTSVNIDNE